MHDRSSRLALLEQHSPYNRSMPRSSPEILPLHSALTSSTAEHHQTCSNLPAGHTPEQSPPELGRHKIPGGSTAWE